MTTLSTNNKYMVQGMEIDGTEWARIMTALEIFRMMDKQDCSGTEISIWKIGDFGEAPKECFFIGKWMFKDDPQRMEIKSFYGIEDAGYGEEH